MTRSFFLFVGIAFAEQLCNTDTFNSGTRTAGKYLYTLSARVFG